MIVCRKNSPQNIEVLLNRELEGRPQSLRVYCESHLHEEAAQGVGKPDPRDLPIQGGVDSAKLADTMKAWLIRHEEWRSSRRFIGALSFGNLYNINRIVAAANMYDVLPASAHEKTRSPDDQLTKECVEFRKVLKKLKKSDERDSLLGALGRLGKPNLRTKIQSRIDVVTRSLEIQLPDLTAVAGHAVKCRNYYVHGTIGAFDYNSNFDQVCFFTDTLEMIFVITDLLDCGWDIDEWMKRGSIQSHSIGRFISSYPEALNALHDVLLREKD